MISLLIQIYLLFNFIEYPTRSNFIVFTTICNIFLLGYVYAIYVMVLLVIFCLVEHPEETVRLMDQLMVLIDHQQTKYVVLPKLTYYCHQLASLYHHPTLRQQLLIVTQIDNYIRCHLVMYAQQYISKHLTMLDKQLCTDIDLVIGTIVRI
jgi:hypothetical protein